MPASTERETVNSTPGNSYHPWPRRLACLLVCATFPLIWVGGLVTTYDAGMAVPDWPSTYGYNLFLYPWQSWVAGPWDLFVEHGHRLLGALVGMITIALVVATWRCDQRRWVRWLSVACLGLVIVQGLLGGGRVLMDARRLALIHGCTGPLFFALAAVMATVTSRRWFERQASSDSINTSSIPRIATITALLAYAQLVFGANLRHVSPFAGAEGFRAALWFHLIVAGLLMGHVVYLAGISGFKARTAPQLWKPAWLLLLLVGIQIALGCGTWVVKYGFPAWSESWTASTGLTILAEGPLQAMTVTAHVATGSLILAFATTLSVRAFQLMRIENAVSSTSASMVRAAT